MTGWLALVGGAVLSGVEGERASPGTLLVSGDRIHGIHRSAEAARCVAGDALERVDVTGLTVLPGMIDCHLHLFRTGGYDAFTDLSFAPEAAAGRAARCLRAGVTTVRDLGAPEPKIFRLRDEIAAGGIPGPRIVAAGRPLTIVNGHGGAYGGYVGTGRDLVPAIRDAARRGADCIKIIISGGAADLTTELSDVLFREDDLRAAVGCAHDLGLRVAAHASNPVAVRLGARAGFDSIEHAVLTDDTAIEALANGTSVLVAHARRHGPAAGVPRRRARRAGYQGEGADHSSGPPRQRTPGDRGRSAGRGGYGWRRVHPARPDRAGAHQLVECGLSTEAAVAAVTRWAASLLGLGDELGTLEAGRRADVVVVVGDPLADIRHLADVRLVVKDGRVFTGVPAARTFHLGRADEQR